MKTYINEFPSADELADIRESLRRSILRRIINALVESDSITQVKKIVAQNSVYMRLFPILYKFAERAMIRIRHLEIQKRINWKEYLN
jgi:hypothetical protein